VLPRILDYVDIQDLLSTRYGNTFLELHMHSGSMNILDCFALYGREYFLG